MSIRLSTNGFTGRVVHDIAQGALTATVTTPSWNRLPATSFSVGVNASGYGSSTEAQAQPYLNICKSMRDLTFGLSGGGVVTYDTIKADGYTDADGYVTETHPDAVGGLQAFWAWTGDGWGPIAGRYKFTYDGPQISGTTGAAITVVSDNPGELVFDFRPDGGNFGWFWGAFTSDNYPRNFVCVKEDYQDLYDAGEIFNPQYIESLEGLCVLRHLNTMNTNNSTFTSINDYPEESHYNWSPIPLSIIAKLANKTGIDPWVCMPHRAMQIGAPGEVDTTFATDICTYFKSALDPKLMLFVQNSNETWNPGFSQYSDVFNESAHRGWSETSQAKPHGWWAMADVVLAQACKAVYGDEAPERLHYSAGSQAGNVSITQEFATASIWQSEEPDNWIDPASVLDSICIAPYFFSQYITIEGEIDLLKTRIDAGDTEQELITYLDLRLKELGLAQITKDRIINSKAVIGAIPLYQYEGGTHLQHSFTSGVPQDDLRYIQEALTAYSYSPEMAAVYADVFDTWAANGDGFHMDYAHIGQPSIFGSFNMARSLDDFDNPRASYLINRSKTETPWWSDPRRA